MFTVLANMVLQCFHKFLKFCRGQHFFAEEQAVKRIMDRGCWKQDRGSPVVYFSTGAIPAGFFFAGVEASGALGQDVKYKVFMYLRPPLPRQICVILKKNEYII